MVSQHFNDQEHYENKRPQKPEWEPTSADPEKDKEEDPYYISGSPESLGPEGDLDSQNEFNEQSGAQGKVSNVLVLKLKRGQPPTPEQLGKLIQTALDQGWETLYVYKGNRKTPDLQMAQYIQQFIMQQNLQEKINCCLSTAAYGQYKSIDDIQKEAISKGAETKPDINI
jgi:hypothetical protein